MNTSLGFPAFGGMTYEPELDGARLAAQLERVKHYLFNGEWWTLHDLAEEAGFPEASISARIRDLRKEKFGAYIVVRKRRGGRGGTFLYRVVM